MRNDTERNAKLLVSMTAKGLGMAVSWLRSRGRVRSKPTESGKLKAALSIAAELLDVPPGLPPFDPSVCQDLMTNAKAIALYDEFPERSQQILFAGGKAGTIWMKVGSSIPFSDFSKPLFVVGWTADDCAVVRQDYIDFLRQYAKPVPEDLE